jgi:hypothetical protein
MSKAVKKEPVVDDATLQSIAKLIYADLVQRPLGDQQCLKVVSHLVGLLTEGLGQRSGNS